MDHNDRTVSPIEARYPFAFALRDLASNEQLDWTPVDSKDAETTNLILETRYGQFGAPLVQKADRAASAPPPPPGVPATDSRPSPQEIC